VPCLTNNRFIRNVNPQVHVNYNIAIYLATLNVLAALAAFAFSFGGQACTCGRRGFSEAGKARP